MRPKPTRFLLPLAALSVLIAASVVPRSANENQPNAPTARPAKDGVTIALADWPASQAARRGRVVYEENCIGCHGQEGKGDGPASLNLNPVPRNFQKAKFKFRSSESGQLPFEEDLLRTVECGLPGSSMPGFPLLPQQQRKDVVAYVLDVAVFGRAKVLAEAQAQDEGLTREQLVAKMPELAEKTRASQLGGRKKVIVPPAVPATPELIERGRQLYAKQCASCHGDTGRGDGTSAFALRDWSDAEIRPRDFTTGVFRAGSTAQDLFLRMRTGLNGTPMPASNENDETVWSIVHYILSLKTPGTIPNTRRMGCDRGN